MGKGGKGKGGKGKGGGKGFGGKGGGKSWNEGPPASIEEMGKVMHECEDDLIVKCTHSRIPQFNARIFLENQEHIGKVDEIFGAINDFMFSVKMNEGCKAKSFKEDSKMFIDPEKTLALERFLPQKPGGKGGKGKGKGGKGKGGKGDKGGKGKGGKSFGGKSFGKGGDKGGKKGVKKGGSKKGAPY